MDLGCKGDPESLRVALSHCEADCSFVQVSDLGMTFHFEEVSTQSAA